MADQSSLVQIFSGLKEQIALLAFSGVGGAFFRAVLAPEEQWKRRVVQGISGALSGKTGLRHLAGAFFYIGREVRDLEKGHNWDLSRMDWEGLLWPAVPLFVIDAALRF